MGRGNGELYDHTPLGRGFESFYRYFSHANDYYTKESTEITFSYNDEVFRPIDFWEDDHPLPVNPRYEEYLFKNRIKLIIRDHNPQVPLFLYYGSRFAHKPMLIPRKYLDKFAFVDEARQQNLSASLSMFDDVLGEIVQELKERKLWDNLLLILASDNGGPITALGNLPLRGGKFSDWQGGVRTNAFVSGGYLPQEMRGRKIDGYVHVADWYATLCGLAGIDAEDEMAERAGLPQIDSIDLWPLLSGKTTRSPREDVPISYDTLISGQYKILTGTVYRSGWYGSQVSRTQEFLPETQDVSKCGFGCLYDIKNDPGEHENLAKKMPRVLETMQKKLRQYQATYFDPIRGGEWPAAEELSYLKYHKHLGPFVP